MSIKITALGQAGFRLEADRTVVYVDPYLTNSVAERYGDQLRRQRPAVDPATIVDAHLVLLTHAHLDHTDPATLTPLSHASPSARFVGPNDVIPVLRSAGISDDRVSIADPGEPIEVGAFRISTVAAAHTAVERDHEGFLKYVGFVLRTTALTVYHSGDTIPAPEVFDGLGKWLPIDCALLPVNERNYFRDEQGIVGNMTIREAFAFASRLGVKTLIPMHWDLFEPNSVYPEEIELLYRLTQPGFALRICRAGEELTLR